MKYSTKALIIGIAFGILMFLGWSHRAESIASPAPVTATISAPKEAKPKLTHAQEVWISALEWCESRGNNSAINPKDRDNTPSYGAFQFKPSTLDYYAKMYGVATTTLMDYKTQKAVVEQMVLHRKEIKWTQQFPDCVKRLGPPPAK